MKPFFWNNKKPNTQVLITEPIDEFVIVDEYPVESPYSKVMIIQYPEKGESLNYRCVERPLGDKEKAAYSRMQKIVSKELKPPQSKEVDPKDYLRDQIQFFQNKYRKSMGDLTEEQKVNVNYYLERDLIGYGPLHVLLNDPQIEDISCNGLNTPIYVWHRKYESIPTDISFTSNIDLNNFITKLAHKSGKHISSAHPILDARLPENHRLAATFMNEVSPKGSTFCVRKFKADPLSIVDMISGGTITEKLAAYFWLLLEAKKNLMIIGGTGAGKTSLLNAVISLMSVNDKIITVEEVPELAPPLNNWSQFTSRQTFKFGARDTTQNIDLFDLVKICLRYRPDYIVVGEVRGEEAYTLFQAIATGHGGLCTMHANGVDQVVKRLTSPPMNVSAVYIPLMNVVIHVERVKLPGDTEERYGRRVTNVWEIDAFESYNNVVTWNPMEDTYDTYFHKSILLESAGVKKGSTLRDQLLELDKRATYLTTLRDSGIRDQQQVALKILDYSSYQPGVDTLQKTDTVPLMDVTN
jgi:flagellar protein FlaI